jgi:hypothetical protein
VSATTRKAWIGLAGSALLVAVALLWSARTIRTSIELARRLEMREADLAEIRNWAERLRQSDLRIETVRRQESRTLVSPTDLFARMTPAAPAPTVEEPPPLAPESGWRVRRMELEFREVALPAFGAWLAACENLSPAWRATRIRVEGESGAGAGQAGVTLSLEGIETEAP